MAQLQTALVLTNFNEAEPQSAFEIRTNVPVDEPGPGQVLVRLTLRPVNPADLISLQGLYPGIKQELPTVPGVEGVGHVERSGPGATKFGQGARVVGVPFGMKFGRGTWQNYVVVPEADLVQVPPEVSDEAAAQFYVNPMTIMGFFDVLEIPKDEYLLQSAAGSVLGRELIQLAKHKGIRTINVVRRKEQVEELKDCGADEVIVSSDGDIAERVLQISGGKGAYAAVDAVAGEMTGQLLAAIRPQGTLLVYGSLSGFVFSAGVPDLLFSRKVLTGFQLGMWKESLPSGKWQQLVDEMMGFLASGIITPLSGRSYPLTNASEAVVESIRVGRGGKIFLKG